MIEFFSYAPANLKTGSSSKIREMLDVNQRQQLSGLVEINFEQRDDRYLLLNGEAVGTYYLTATSSTQYLSPILINAGLVRALISVRSLCLAMQSASSAWLVNGISCSVAAHQSSGLRNILQVFLVNKTCGLLRVIDTAGELAVPIIDGFTVAAEAVFSAVQVDIGPSALSRGMQPSSNNCTVVLYEARPDTASFKQLILRQVISELAESVLRRYNEIVGGRLLSAMGNELNQVLRLNRLHMQLVGEHLDNSHIFKSMEDATRSYSVLFKALHVHMTHVIGIGLAGSLQKEAYRSLNPRNQAAIDEQPILNSVQR
jgi:hypothetical protein